MRSTKLNWPSPAWRTRLCFNSYRLRYLPYWNRTAFDFQHTNTVYEVSDYVFYPHKHNNCSIIPFQHQLIIGEMNINLCIIHPRSSHSLHAVCHFFKRPKKLHFNFSVYLLKYADIHITLFNTFKLPHHLPVLNKSVIYLYTGSSSVNHLPTLN